MTGPDSTESPQADLSDLIAATAAGDEAALAELYDRTHVWIFGLVKKVLNDVAEAEEVTLDVYWQIWKSAQGYRRSKGSPGAWIAMLARSRAIDRWRSGQNDRSLLVDDFPIDELFAGPAEPAAAAALGEQTTAIRQALDELGAEQRAVVFLAYFNGFSQSEIAERLMMPIGSVKTHARNGLMKLRTLLAPHSADVHD